MSAARGGRKPKAQNASPGSIFENEDATEWLESFETDGARAIDEVLTAVAELEAGGFVDGPEAAYALVAAELVAAARDGDVSRLPESLAETLDEHRDEINAGGYAKSAQKAVVRVLRRSELKDQWDAEEDAEARIEEIRELQERLRG